MKHTPLQKHIEWMQQKLAQCSPMAPAIPFITMSIQHAQSLLPYERECIMQTVKDNIPSLNILTQQNLRDIAEDYFTQTFKTNPQGGGVE